MKKISPIKEQKSASETDVHTQEDAAERLARLLPYSPDVTVMTVVCRHDDYSAARIAHAIEDCNAHVLNLNLTADALGEGLVAVEVRVDRKNIASIARSLARYDYTVVGIEDNDDIVGEKERRRIAELLRYIDI